MLLTQELTTKLAMDQYCLLSGSLGGDRFPIATVQLFVQSQMLHSQLVLYCTGPEVQAACQQPAQHATCYKMQSRFWERYQLWLTTKR